MGRPEEPHVRMEGGKVFSHAVRQMIDLLQRACDESSISVDELDLIVPHQANGRILEAIASRLKLQPGRLINRVGMVGNTSSSTIPLVLAELLAQSPRPKGRAGLCAFGGGFTFGAGVVDFVSAGAGSKLE